MSGVKIAGTSGVEVNVDVNNSLQATGPSDPTKAGFQIVAFQRDAGTITGTRYIKNPRVSENARLRVGIDSILDDERFIYSAQNTGKHQSGITTLTWAWGSGYMTSNSGNVTTVSTGQVLRTYRHFSLFGAASLWAEIELAFSALFVTNTTVDYGFFIPAATNPYAPTDGVFFRANSAGLQGVLNINGTETATSVFPFTPTLNQNYTFRIIVSEGGAEFWINDVMYGEIDTPVSEGNPFRSSTVPIAIRHAIVGGAASGVFNVKVSGYSVALQDLGSARPWQDQMSGAGFFGANAPGGQAQGRTAAGLTYNTAPTAATPTANTAALVSGLGGYFIPLISGLAVNTDYIVMAYQNPVATSVLAGRTLYIKGCKIDTMLGSLAVSIPMAYMWTLYGGAVSVSLSATEGSNVKIPRVIPLGMQFQASSATIGTTGTPTITERIDPPLPINPGEWAVVGLRFPAGGYAGQTGMSLHTVIKVDAYWE